MSEAASQEATDVVRAGVLVSGNEVLNGTIPDRNGPWLSERLAGEGVEVSYLLTVADRPEDLEAALCFLRDQGVQLVVTTGGLGPTADDLTAEVVARHAGRGMRLDPDLEARIGAVLADFARRQNLDPEALAVANRKQAQVPEGAVALNPVGTAPGLIVPSGEQLVLVLPGPPRELQPMWEVAVQTEPLRSLLDRAGSLESARLRLFGLPESEIAATLRGLEASGVDLDRIETTTCLRRGELEVDLRWRPGHGEVADAVREEIARRHPDHLFSTDGSTIDELVAARLRGRSVATAESCTGGLLAARLTGVSGASGYFTGGAVTYSNEAKQALLGVDAGLLERHGAVAPETAAAMAEGALERFRADVAVSITGIAGPGGGSEEKPVGYVCFCALSSEGSRVERSPVIPGGREDIRERSALVAMHMLLELLGPDRELGSGVGQGGRTD